MARLKKRDPKALDEVPTVDNRRWPKDVAEECELWATDRLNEDGSIKEGTESVHSTRENKACRT
jgi:hypothetical protein